MPTAHRLVKDIQKDLAAAKRSATSILRAAGDDYGCDGTREAHEAALGWVRSYESELAEARAARRAA